MTPNPIDPISSQAIGKRKPRKPPCHGMRWRCGGDLSAYSTNDYRFFVEDSGQYAFRLLDVNMTWRQHTKVMFFAVVNFLIDLRMKMGARLMTPKV